MSNPKTYSEKLRDPRWQKKRLEIMERDKFTCRHCQATEKTLNVHHAFYEKGKDPWEYDDWRLVTVCEECHEKIERTKEELLACSSEDVPLWKLFSHLKDPKMDAIWFGLSHWIESFQKSDKTGAKDADLAKLQKDTLYLMGILYRRMEACMEQNTPWQK